MNPAHVFSSSASTRRPAAIASAFLLSAAIVASLATSRVAMAEGSSGCQPTLKSTRTDFPTHAVQARAHGTTRVRLTIGQDGRASTVAVAESSGVAALDRAALQSVRQYWLFDVTHCSSTDLAREHTVDVAFKRPKSLTLYASVDSKSVAEAKELRANQQCHAHDLDNGDTVFSCAVTAEQLAARAQAPGGAQRAAR